MKVNIVLLWEDYPILSVFLLQDYQKIWKFNITFYTIIRFFSILGIPKHNIKLMVFLIFIYYQFNYINEICSFSLSYNYKNEIIL